MKNFLCILILMMFIHLPLGFSNTLAYIINGNNIRVLDISTNKFSDIDVGFSATDIAISNDGKFVYITGRDPCSLKIMCTKNNQIISTVPIGCASCLTVTPDNKTIYAGSSEGKFDAIAINTNNYSITTIGGDSLQPSAISTSIAISNDGRYVYIPDYNGRRIVFIDTRTNISGCVSDMVSTTLDSPDEGGKISISGPTARSYAYVTVRPLNNEAYVSDMVSSTLDSPDEGGKISIIDTTTNAIIGTFSVGLHPRFILFSPDGNTAYVETSSQLEDTYRTIAVVDVANKKVVANIVDIGGLFTYMALTPDGTSIYAVSEKYDPTTDKYFTKINVIDTSTKKLINTIDFGSDFDMVGGKIVIGTIPK